VRPRALICRHKIVIFLGHSRLARRIDWTVVLTHPRHMAQRAPPQDLKFVYSMSPSTFRFSQKVMDLPYQSSIGDALATVNCGFADSLESAGIECSPVTFV
jgi:hypothetical protein